MNTGLLLGDMSEELIDAETLSNITFSICESNGENPIDFSKSKAQSDAREMAEEFLRHNFDVSSDEASDMARNFVRDTFSLIWEQYADNGYSLWISLGDVNEDMGTPLNKEYRIYSVNPSGQWISAARDAWVVSDERMGVSHAFLIACGQLPDGDEETNGFGNCQEEIYTRLSDVEQKLWFSLRNLLIGQIGMSYEQTILIEKGKLLINDGIDGI